MAKQPVSSQASSPTNPPLSKHILPSTSLPQPVRAFIRPERGSRSTYTPIPLKNPAHRSGGSVSSKSTMSSIASVHKIHPSHDLAFLQSESQAEQGFMSHTSHRSSVHRSIFYQGREPQIMSDGHQNSYNHNGPVFSYVSEQDEPQPQKDHTLWILFWLSSLDPVLSTISALHSLLTALVILLSSPIQLCRPSYSVKDLAITLLSPMHKTHLQLMYASTRDKVDSFQYRATTLVTIQVVSPLISIGVMFATWTVASFWLFTIMMGNPDGTERRDDGKAAVLAVRNWWKRFLMTAVR